MDDFIFGSMDSEVQRLQHYYRSHSGFSHLSARAPRDPLPGQPVRLTAQVGQGQHASRLWVYYSGDGSDPEGRGGAAICGQVQEMRWISARWDDLTWGYVHTYECSLPGQPENAIVRYRIAAQTDGGQELFADGGAYYAYTVDHFEPPGWAREAVFYHILVDRFAPTPGMTWNSVESIEGIYGGSLAGIHSRLGYLRDLGINALYLSPIFPADNHHRYNASNYFEIDPVVGTKDQFLALLDDLHGHGMRLVLDFVPNHWSDRHATFQAAISDPNSPYRRWYTFTHYPDQYATFFNVPVMPQINLRNPDARKHMIDAACYWLDFGVDGLRLDYAIGPSPDFWADLRLAARRTKPDCWLVGEVVDSVNVQLAFEGLLDGCLDFVLLDALRQTFATRAWTAERFAGFLQGHQAVFPAGYSRPCFLDNHDMDRFLWGAQGDKRKLRLAALCQFVLPGTPMIYYGTEVGLSQQRGTRETRGSFGRLEEARLPMPWDNTQDLELLAYYQSLIRLRRQEAALRQGDWRLLYAGQDSLAFSRGQGGNALQCAFNLADEARLVELARGFSEVVFATPGDQPVETRGERGILLPPLSGLVLR